MLHGIWMCIFKVVVHFFYYTYKVFCRCVKLKLKLKIEAKIHYVRIQIFFCKNYFFAKVGFEPGTKRVSTGRRLDHWATKLDRKLEGNLEL